MSELVNAILKITTGLKNNILKHVMIMTDSRSSDHGKFLVALVWYAMKTTLLKVVSV